MMDTMRRTVEDRFWPKVDPTGFCWNWAASRNKFGYGKFRLDGSIRPAHRVAYELLIGPIPDGLDLDHLCRNRSCVNPDHLEPVTNRENVARGLLGSPETHYESLKTHCPNGHPYAGGNLYTNPRGHRVCRVCQNEARLRHTLRRRAERTPTVSAPSTGRAVPAVQGEPR